MVKNKPRKIVTLFSGRENGALWDLRVAVAQKSRKYNGYFIICDKRRLEKLNTRRRDRNFFEARLGKKYMEDKVVHHRWSSKDGITWTFVLSKNQHSYGSLGKKRMVNKRDWEDKEEWLKCGTGLIEQL